jgi:predicted dehydrogenase/threonine dehydrogenase-like Zn-dependent dehydrogenase
MKQVIRRGLREIIVDEVPDPTVTAGNVLVRPYYSLISPGTETADIHTDNILKEVADNPSHLRTLWNVMKKTDPISTFNEVRAKFNDYAVLGYSGAGVVVDRGSKVTDLSIGQRVAYGGEGTGHGETINVGRNLVARIPEGVPFRDASFTTLGAIAMNSVRLAKIEVGEVVAVIGLGLIGQLVTQLVRCQGGVVVAIDLDRSRVDLAIESGADHGVVSSESVVSEVRALTGGRGADCVIVAAAAGTAAPLKQGVSMSCDRGRIIMVGACPIEIPRAEMYIKELTFLVSRAYGPGSYDPLYEKQGIDYPIPYVRWTENRNMEEFLRLLSVRKVDVKPLISHEFELNDAPKAYQGIMGDGATLGVVLRYPVSNLPDAVASFNPVRVIQTGRKAMTDGEVRFAVVGAGNLAKWAHLPAIQKINGASVHAIYSNNGPRGKSYAQRFGANYATSDYSQILNDKDVNAVLVASRHSDHSWQVLEALKAGKHVFVEKPMALTLVDCRAIHEAARKSGRQVMVGFNRRFAPYYVEMKDRLLRSGPKIISIRVNSPGLETSWAADHANGGVLLSEGCHFIDLMYWITDSEPLSVSAHSLAENNFTASITFADGSIGNFLYTVVGSESSGGELVEVFAPGIAVSSEDFKSLTIKGRARKKKTKLFAAKGYREQLLAFVESVKSGINVGATTADGTRATLGCLLILESARTGVGQEFRLGETLGDH